MNFIVPPGGFAGFSQMTAASRRALTAGRTTTGTRRKRRKKASAKRGKRAARAKGRKLKFGSPAWRKKYGTGKRKKRK